MNVSLSKSRRPVALALALRAVATSIGPLVLLPPNAMLFRALTAASFREPLLGAESPRMLSGSRRIGGRLAQSPKSARANTRRLRCATPNHCASRHAHSSKASSPTAQPSLPHFVFFPTTGGSTWSSPAISATTAAKSRPLLLLNAPKTFSQRANRSPHHRRSHRTIRIASKKSPLRSPSNPFLLPARLKS